MHEVLSELKNLTIKVESLNKTIPKSNLLAAELRALKIYRHIAMKIVVLNIMEEEDDASKEKLGNEGDE